MSVLNSAGLLAFAAALSVSALSYATIVDTVTVTGSHAANPDSTSTLNVQDLPLNSTQIVNLTPGNTIRRINFTGGTVTKVINVASAFTSDAAFRIGGPGLSAAPINRTQGLTASGGATAVTPFTVFIPGGFNSTAPLSFNAIDTFNDGAGVDLTSSSTVTFDTEFAPGSVEYRGTTRGGPTYVRATGFNTPGTPASRTVSYSALRFTVGTAGVYTIASAQNYDGYLSLYADQFDPNFAPGNLVSFGDEAFNVLRDASLGPVTINTSTSSGTSLFNASLLPGTEYILVTSGYANPDSGDFINLITGPGSITIVPEPMSLGLAGLGAMALLGRRRRA